MQRFVLAQLDEQALAEIPGLWLHARTITERLFGAEPTTQQIETVRRAIRLLERQGLVETEPRGVSAYQAADWPERLRSESTARLVVRIPFDKRQQAVDRRAGRDR